MTRIILMKNYSVLFTHVKDGREVLNLITLQADSKDHARIRAFYLLKPQYLTYKLLSIEEMGVI